MIWQVFDAMSLLKRDYVDQSKSRSPEVLEFAPE